MNSNHVKIDDQDVYYENVIETEIEVKLNLRDRIKLLFSGKLDVKVCNYFNNLKLNLVGSKSEIKV